jgi:hypothetical protein
VLDPFATIESGDTEIVDWAALAGPTVNTTVAVEASALPFSVPEMTALRTVVAEVKVALYVPLA